MKHFFKLLSIIVASVVGAIGVGIGILYLTGGFDKKTVEPTNMAFVSTEVLTAGPTDLKIVTTTEDVGDYCYVDLSVKPAGIITIPNQVRIGERFVVWPIKDVDNQNKGGKVEITASYKGKLVTKCKVFVDVAIETIKVSTNNAAVKWGESVNFTTTVTPERALNPNNSTAGVVWEGYSNKTIYYYLVDKDEEALEEKYAEFAIGSELVGTKVTSKQIEQAAQQGKAVSIKTKNMDQPTPVEFFVKAYAFDTYINEEKYASLIEEEQLAHMVLDENSNPDKPNYHTGNGIVATNFEINGIDSNLKSTDPANLKVVEAYLYQETVLVADMKTTTSSDTRKDLDISLYTDTPGADLSIMDYFIRDKVTLSLDDPSYFSFGTGADAEGNYAPTIGGATTDYWTWRIIWNTPDVNNYEALNKEFIVTVKYDNSETIQFSFKIKIVEKASTGLTYETGTDKDYFTVKSGEELKITSDLFTVSPDDATFKTTKLAFTSLRNDSILYIPDVAGKYKVTFAFLKELEEDIASRVRFGGIDELAPLNYYSSPDMIEANRIDDIVAYKGFVYVSTEYTRGASNVSSDIPFVIEYETTIEEIEIHNVKFYKEVIGGFSENPFLKINHLEIVTDFDVQTDKYDYIYIIIKASENSLVIKNIGKIVATAQVVYSDKDGRSVSNGFGEYILTDTNVSFDIDVYDEVSQLEFFESNPITDLREGTTGIEGTALGETPVLAPENYVLAEDSAYYIYVKSENIEAFDEAVDGVDRTQISITPYCLNPDVADIYYEAIEENNINNVIISDVAWERVLVGTEYGYRIKFILDNCFSFKVGGAFLDLIYKVEIKVDKATLIGYFGVLDNIIEGADIKYDGRTFIGTDDTLEVYYSTHAGEVVSKAYGEFENAVHEIILNDDEEVIFDKISFNLIMADGSETASTMRYEVKNLTNSVSIDNLVAIKNGKIYAKNVPYVEGGVRVKFSISSEGYTVLNSFYEFNGSEFNINKNDIKAEFELLLHGFEVSVDVNPEAEATVKGIKLSRIKLAVEDETKNRLLFTIRDKRGNAIDIVNLIDVSKIIDFVIYAGEAQHLYGVSGADIIILDDISTENNIVVRLYIGENIVYVAGAPSYTITIDPIFNASVVPGSGKIEAPQINDKITDIITHVTRNETNLSTYTNFFVNYVVKEGQTNYENISKYVTFTNVGLESFVTVTNIPADMDVQIELTIYEELGKGYRFEIEDKTFTYQKGFFNGNKEFPVSDYEYGDITVDDAVITYQEQTVVAAPIIELAEIEKEYRTVYNDEVYVFNGSNFMNGEQELPLKSYDYIEGDVELTYHASTYEVKTFKYISYPKVAGTKYIYNEEDGKFYDEAGTELPVKDFIIDWEEGIVSICDTTIDVEYIGNNIFTLIYGSDLYQYNAEQNDFIFGGQRLRDIIGYYYWEQEIGKFDYLYHIGADDKYQLGSDYLIEKDGTEYKYDSGDFRFKDEAGNILVEEYTWSLGDELLYYAGPSDILPVNLYYVAEYLGTKYTYREGFFNGEDELSDIFGVYVWTYGDSTLTYSNDGTDVTVDVVEYDRLKEILVKDIVLSFSNIYKDSNLSLGEKFYQTVDLENKFHSFVYEDEIYFYNQDTEQFVTLNGKVFAYDILSWGEGVLIYEDAENSEHSLVVTEDAGRISVNYEGVEYVYSDMFVLKEETAFPYELTAIMEKQEDARVVKYYAERKTLTVNPDAGLGVYITLTDSPDPLLNTNYYYDEIEQTFVDFPYYLIPGFVATPGSVVEYVNNRLAVEDYNPADGTAKLRYNGMLFEYNSLTFNHSGGRYEFALDVDVSTIDEGYVTLKSESVELLDDAQLGFVYLNLVDGKWTTTINSVKYVLHQNFYEVGTLEKLLLETVVDLDNNVVTVGGATQPLVANGVHKEIVIAGRTYRYTPELFAAEGSLFPQNNEIIEVDKSNIHNDANGAEAAGYVVLEDTTRFDLYQEGADVYYINYEVLNGKTIRYYYKQAFISTDGYNTEFAYEIDYSKSTLVNGGKLYFTNDADDRHTLDLYEDSFPVRYFVVYDTKEFNYEFATGRFYNDERGYLDDYIVISDFSLLDGTIEGTIAGAPYTGLVLIADTYVERYYVLDESLNKYYFIPLYNDGGTTYDAFVYQPAVGSDVIYKVETISGNTLRYSIPGIINEYFEETIYKEANFAVAYKTIEYDSAKYIYNGTMFVNVNNGEAFPYDPDRIDFVRGKVHYAGTEHLDITTVVPHTSFDYNGKTYYHVIIDAKNMMFDKDGHKFEFNYDEDAVRLENKEFEYIKYDNHIIAGVENGAVINLDGIYNVYVGNTRYFYDGATSFISEAGIALPGITNIDLATFTLYYNDGEDKETHIYGEYESFDVTFEDVEGVDYSTNASVAEHMRYNSNTKEVYSYDLNCDKDVWVVVTIQFKDGGETVIRKKITVVKNLYIDMVNDASFIVASNPMGLLLTKDSLYTDSVCRIDSYGNRQTLSPSDYVFYDPVNQPTNIFEVAQGYKHLANIVIDASEDVFLKPINDNVTSTTDIQVVYKYCVKTDNGHYYLQYQFNIELLVKVNG